MYYILIYLILSTIGIGCSFPIATANNIPYLEILTDYLSFMTFCGVVCGVILLLCRYITKHFFNPNQKIWLISDKETKIYEKIKLKKWKSIVPDFGKLVGFKKKVDSTQAKNSEFYYRFLYENVNAELLHGFDIVFAPFSSFS